MSDGLEQCLTPCRPSVCIMEKMSGRGKKEAGDGGGVVILNRVNGKDVSKKMTFEQGPERSEGISQVAIKR